MLLDRLDNTLDDHRAVDIVQAQPHHVESVGIHSTGAGRQPRVVMREDGSRSHV